MYTVIAGLALAFASVCPAGAQQTAGDYPMILLSSQKASVDYLDTTLVVKVKANTDVELVQNVNWISGEKLADNNYAVKVKTNVASEQRVGTLGFKAAGSNFVRTFTVTQARENVASIIPQDTKIPVVSATAFSELRPNSTDFSQDNSSNIAKSIDGNPNTIWHSPWSNTDDPKYFPIEVVYNLENAGHVDYVMYTPRSGGGNGCFQKFELWYKCAGDEDFTKQGDYNFNGSGSVSTLYLGPDGKGVENPVAVKFVVHSGVGNFASCAEMGFYRSVNMQNGSDYEYFTDKILSELRPGVKAEDVEKMTDPLCKLVATNLLNGYDKRFRVASYPCLLAPQALSALWNTPGKLYDQLQGVTGINISAGKHIVLVEGIPNGLSVNLKVVAWYSAPVVNGTGSGPREFTFALKNGANVVDYDFGYDGLAYISYYVNENPENYKDIRVHFVNGQVNGYLTPHQTNAELDGILAKATNRCIDLVGDKAHSIWEAEAMKSYCRDISGTKKGYVQYMNILDSLVDYEHYLLGFKKYNRVPKNKTMAYVNYTYYMFQGGYGVSFKYDTQSRVLNCQRIALNDGDAIWGLSHEWGHQHQLYPYFCWKGMAEVSNNMNTCYNVLRMGYKKSNDGAYGRILSQWNNSRKAFLSEDTYAGKASSGRASAYKNRTRMAHPEYTAMAEEQLSRGDTLHIPAWKEGLSTPVDVDHAVSIHEVGIEQTLAPYFMLYSYFVNPGANYRYDYMPDYQLDLYEALRQTDDEAGSQIEKTSTEPDKYELLASACNNNKNGAYARFAAKYPESCWNKNGYVKSTTTPEHNTIPFILHYIRKASMVCGYNLYPFFEKFGAFRTIVLWIGDYGDGVMALTPSMRDEFKADMDKLVTDGVVKTMDEDMVNRISTAAIVTFPNPDFPNEPVVK